MCQLISVDCFARGRRRQPDFADVQCASSFQWIASLVDAGGKAAFIPAGTENFLRIPTGFGSRRI